MHGQVQRLTVSQSHSHLEYGGPRRWFAVYIHPDADHLRTAATRYTATPAAKFEGCIACVHPAAHRERWDDEAQGWAKLSSPTFAGVVRLARGCLTSEVLAHEMVHAALAIYRMDVDDSADIGDTCGDREETLAYILGDLVAGLSNKLHEANAWDEVA